jgi:hypothetical protein
VDYIKSICAPYISEQDGMRLGFGVPATPTLAQHAAEPKGRGEADGPPLLDSATAGIAPLTRLVAAGRNRYWQSLKAIVRNSAKVARNVASRHAAATLASTT